MIRFAAFLFFLVYLFTVPAFSSIELNFNKATAEYSKENFETSVELLQNIISADPKNAKANHLLGLSYLQLKDYDNSLKYLKIAKSLDPDIKNIDLDLGTSYLKTEDFKNASLSFDQAVSKNPESGITHYNLGYSNFLLGNYEEAVTSFKKSKELDEKLAVKADYFTGISNFRLNQYQASKENFEFVLKGNPSKGIAKSVEDYIDVINSYNKKYYGTITSGLQYDTNVSLEPDDINIFSNENDFSSIFYVNLGYKPILNDKSEIGLDYKGFLSLHFDITDFNIQNHRFTIFGKRSFDNGIKIFSDYSYELVFIGDSTVDELFSQTHSFRPGISYAWNDVTSTDFTYNIKYRDFEDFPERDAFNHRWAISQTFNLFSGKFFFVPGAAVSLNSADDIVGTRNYDYISPEVFVDTLALFKQGFSAFFNVYYFHQNYYNDSLNRDDDQLGLRVVLSKTLYDSLSLDLGYQYVLNHSNSSFFGFEPFEYTRNIFTTALSYRF
ncbi:MAG: tetratricopeptide repeat protein [Thermodesulfobacteriota bacterium]